MEGCSLETLGGGGVEREGGWKGQNLASEGLSGPLRSDLSNLHSKSLESIFRSEEEIPLSAEPSVEAL